MFGLLLPDPAGASEQSRALIEEGVAALGERDYAAALAKFKDASAADPRDPEAWFFQGAALNRLGRHVRAAARLERAKALGSRHPDLAFETGWALLQQGLWRQAIAQLEGYEERRPGRGQTAEFLGRAHLGLREYQAAEAAFAEALRRDPGLTATVLYQSALLESARGDLARARQHLERLLREAPDSPLARALAERLARAAKAAPAPEKPWRVSVSAGGGYNDNVIALGSGVNLPADISDESSPFSRVTLNGSYEWRLSARDTLAAGLGFRSDIYSRVRSSDLLDHNLALTYRHRFGGGLVASFRAADSFTLIDERAFRNQLTLRPGIAYRVAGWLISELAYGFASSAYLFPGSVVQDRDGFNHNISLTNYVAVPGTELELRLGYFHTRNNADGGDFDFYANGGLIGLSYPLPWEVTLDGTYSRSVDRYNKLNSLAGLVGFAFEREDETDRATVQLTRPLGGGLRVYVRYDFTRVDSNIRFFDYSQQVGSAGLVAEF